MPEGKASLACLPASMGRFIDTRSGTPYGLSDVLNGQRLSFESIHFAEFFRFELTASARLRVQTDH